MGAGEDVEGWTRKQLRAAIGRRARVSKKATKEELLAVYRSLEATGESGPIGLAAFTASTRDGMVAELDRLGIAHPPRATKRELTALYEAQVESSAAAPSAEPSVAEPSVAEREPEPSSEPEPMRAQAPSEPEPSSESEPPSEPEPMRARAPSEPEPSSEPAIAVAAVEPAPESPARPKAAPPWEPLAADLADDDEPDLVFESLPPEAHLELDAAAADPDPDFRTHRPPAEAAARASLSPEIRVESLPPEEGTALERLAAELPTLPPSAPAAREVPEAERRTSERVRLEVDIGFLSETNFYVGFSSDLSDGGIFIATVDLLPIGRHVLVSFMLPGGYDISTEGVVAWVREGRTFDSTIEPGMGVAFVELDRADRDAIREYTRLREPLFYLP